MSLKISFQETDTASDNLTQDQQDEGDRTQTPSTAAEMVRAFVVLLVISFQLFRTNLIVTQKI